MNKIRFRPLRGREGRGVEWRGGVLPIILPAHFQDASAAYDQHPQIRTSALYPGSGYGSVQTEPQLFSFRFRPHYATVVRQMALRFRPDGTATFFIPVPSTLRNSRPLDDATVETDIRQYIRQHPGSMKISRRNPCSPFFSVSYSINRHKIIQYLFSIIPPRGSVRVQQ